MGRIGGSLIHVALSMYRIESKVEITGHTIILFH